MLITKLNCNCDCELGSIIFKCSSICTRYWSVHPRAVHRMWVCMFVSSRMWRPSRIRTPYTEIAQQQYRALTRDMPVHISLYYGNNITCLHTVIRLFEKNKNCFMNCMVFLRVLQFFCSPLLFLLFFALFVLFSLGFAWLKWISPIRNNAINILFALFFLFLCHIFCCCCCCFIQLLAMRALYFCSQSFRVYILFSVFGASISHHNFKLPFRKHNFFFRWFRTFMTIFK